MRPRLRPEGDYMQVSTENRQIVDADENRQPHIKEIGPHPHAWAFFGTGEDGGRYEVCEMCGTRRVLGIPMTMAAHKDWIEGVEGAEFDPGKEFAAQAKARKDLEETNPAADELEKNYKEQRDKAVKAQAGVGAVPVHEVGEPAGKAKRL